MVAVAALSASLLPPPVAAQAPDPLGIVTALDGRATVARAALPAPLLLKFKDDVFGRDRIRTQENSLVRVLLGGKAILTVRELSQVTIREEPGRAVVTLPNGKVVLAVAKQRMRPGESIEIRTPNAVAAVRGSILAVGYDAALGMTTAICASGSCTYQYGSGPTNQLPVGQRALNAQMAQASAAEVTEAVTVQTGTREFTSPEEGFQTALLESQAAQATQVAQFVSTGVASLALAGPAPTNTNPANAAPVNSTTNTPIEQGQTPGSPPSQPGPITNGGFESGAFGPWALAGGGGVVSTLGPVAPPQGSFMGLIHTGANAVNQRTSTLTQSFTVTGGKLYTILANVRFYSNEHPNQLKGFNDAWQIGVRHPGQYGTTVLKEETRNDVFTFQSTAENTSTEPASAAGFTTNGPGPYGVTEARDFSLSWTPTESGAGDLFFSIFDVGDTGVDSAILIDNVAVLEDPPLFFVQAGETLTRTTTEPLLQLANTPTTFDSLLAIATDGRANLSGPLLRSTDSDLSVPFSLLSVFQGGSLATSSSEPLARLTGGTHSFGSVGVPMFDLSGVNTATDADTGLTVGRDRPLQHAGSLLETSNATVSAHRAVNVDTALLEASAPLLALRNGSALATANDTVRLSYQAKVTSLGSVMALDR
ncbi:MAG: FecR domain-containing protein, partial [Candidatus Rokuibacteriota bacterium]